MHAIGYKQEKGCRRRITRWALVAVLPSLLLTGCGNQAKTGPDARALTALSARADRLAGEDEFSGAVLVAKNGRVLFSHAYGLADRDDGSRTRSRRAFASGR